MSGINYRGSTGEKGTRGPPGGFPCKRVTFNLSGGIFMEIEEYAHLFEDGMNTLVMTNISGKPSSFWIPYGVIFVCDRWEKELSE